MNKCGIPEISRLNRRLIGRSWAVTIQKPTSDGSLCLDVEFTRTRWGAKRKLNRSRIWAN